MKFILGIVIILIGMYFVIKTEKIFSILGPVSIFEKYLGTGNSRFGYKLLGIFFIFIGILTMTNMINGFLDFVLGPLLNYSQG